jgi:hypothetical protein
MEIVIRVMDGSITVKCLKWEMPPRDSLIFASHRRNVMHEGLASYSPITSMILCHVIWIQSHYQTILMAYL